MTASLPPNREIAAALRKTTETLARELVEPSVDVPDWTPFEWRVARAAMAIHGIAQLLAGRLRWSGPDDWDEHLRRQRDHVATRQQRIAALLERIEQAARDCGLACVALKGAALHRRGLCRAGDRPMGDIDLLVRPELVPPAVEMLRSLGYRDVATTWRHGIFEAGGMMARDEFGELPDSQIKIELHSRIAERLPVSEVDISDRLYAGKGIVGLSDYSSCAELMRHLLLHAAGNMVSKWLRLLQLHDIDLLARRMSAEDWLCLANTHGEAEDLWWAYPPMCLATRYFQAPIPESLLAVARLHCPAWLRSASERYAVADVSSSSLWARAAPGIVWARSADEALRYIKARIAPPADEIAFIGEYAASQSWAADGSWYSMPQYGRAWRWMTARPARPQILQAVRLAQPGG